MLQSVNRPPSISVVIPCYGQSHLLTCAIASIQAQSVDSWEVVVVNDGSPDDASAIVNRMRRTDARLTLIEQPNRGLSAARNAGLQAAQGRYIQFLDADDFIAPEKFSHDLALIDTGEPTIVVSDFRYLREDGQSLQNEFTEPRFTSIDHELELAIRWEVDLSIPIHAALFDARLFGYRPRAFDRNLPNHEDFEMWMRLLAQSPRIRYSDSVDAIYRMNPQGMTRNRLAMHAGFRKAMESVSLHPLTRPVVRDALQAKNGIIDNSYGLNRRASLRRVLEAASDQRLVPWRAQAFVQRLFNLDPRSQVTSSRRKFGVL